VNGAGEKEASMASNATEVLARFAATVEYDKIPKRIRECCKDLLLDALACALAGHRGEETHQVAGLASGLAQSKESRVIGGDRQLHRYFRIVIGFYDVPTVERSVK
jgi:2-methylcitrate dehydratase PrpD